MSKFLIPPVSWTAGSSDPENNIRVVFYQIWERATAQYQASVNQITAWRQKTIEQICQHADEQTRILTAEYDRQRDGFDEKYQENLEIARACWTAQDAQLFNEVQNACQLLEFQIVQLESVQGRMDALRVVTLHEQMERKKKQECDASRPEESKPEEKPIIQPTSHIQDNQHDMNDEHENSVSAISDATELSLAVVESSSDNNQSSNSNIECETRITRDNDSIGKCPVCYMIFPLSMTQDQRSQHVNEHYADD